MYKSACMIPHGINARKTSRVILIELQAISMRKRSKVIPCITNTRNPLGQLQVLTPETNSERHFWSNVTPGSISMLETLPE